MPTNSWTTVIFSLAAIRNVSTENMSRVVTRKWCYVDMRAAFYRLYAVSL